MRPYENIRLIDGPDVADIHNQGRQSSVGRIPRGELTHTWTKNPKICHHDRGYVKPDEKKRVRRSLKRSDRARSLKEALDLEEGE